MTLRCGMVWVRVFVGFRFLGDLNLDNFIYIYICIIYTPNLGLQIAVSVREREQGRFRGSTEGARRRSEGASRAREQ